MDNNGSSNMWSWLQIFLPWPTEPVRDSLSGDLEEALERFICGEISEQELKKILPYLVRTEHDIKISSMMAEETLNKIYRFTDIVYDRKIAIDAEIQKSIVVEDDDIEECHQTFFPPI